MKEKNVNDKIVFNYDIYDIVNNVEYEYDYTATLAGIVKKVIPDTEHGGYTKYEVEITDSLLTNGEKYLEPGNTIEITDNRIYRGGRLHDVLYNGKCPQPTSQQIERIIEMYDSNKSVNYPHLKEGDFLQKMLKDNLNYIYKEWYKYGLDKFGLYDEDEFKY